MTFCDSCAPLNGQPAEIDPHDHMRGDAHALRPEGVAEKYSCRVCGAKWERFVGTKSLGMQSGSWITLPPG